GKGIIDSGCSRYMTGNKAYLVDYKDFNGVHVAFGGSKGQITYTECLVLSLNFKLPNENQVLLGVYRQHNMYSFNLENIIPSGGLACLIVKAIVDESKKWHRRLGHVNFKNLNKLVKGNLVRGLPSKIFQNDHICVACHKGKQSNTRPHVEAVSTACYVLSRVLVTMPHNKTPYELLTGKTPIISYIIPFGCHVPILNTIDHLGKFKEKSYEGFIVSYSLNSKAFRVYNLETKRVEENLHPVTLENKAKKIVGPKEANNSAGTKDNLDAGNSHMEAGHDPEYFVLPLWSSYTSTVKCLNVKNGDKKLNEDIGLKTNKEPVDQEDQAFLEELERLKQQAKEADDAARTLRKTFAQSTKDLLLQAGVAKASNTNYVNTASTSVNTAGTIVTTASPSRNVSTAGPSNPNLLSNANQDDS
nr:hypothetical protein [Tanacetum cinerariifolium]